MPLIVLEEGTVRRAKLEDYEEAVYTLASIVPPGKVTTYGVIAKLLGVSPRLVGKILAANENPIIIPCHRVVGSRGDLKGYTGGGARVKRRLLELEGVKILGGKIARNHILEDPLQPAARGAGR
ncbi:MAG: MGMT family protein [Thermoprotei archaeon]|nr:MGMT family protein [Thermoprotei archaeon]